AASTQGPPRGHPRRQLTPRPAVGGRHHPINFMKIQWKPNGFRRGDAYHPVPSEPNPPDPCHRRTCAMTVSRAPSAAGVAVLLAIASASACNRPTPGPVSIRLVDTFEAKQVSGSHAAPPAPARRTEWRFDGAAPPAANPVPPAGPAGASPAPPAFPATRGWEAGPGVEGLAVKDGMLTGRSTTAYPILHVERTTGLENPDQLQAIEVRLRASAGTNVSL